MTAFSIIVKCIIFLIFKNPKFRHPIVNEIQKQRMPTKSDDDDGNDDDDDDDNDDDADDDNDDDDNDDDGR